MKKEKNAKNSQAKASRTSGGVCKMPAGTPKDKADHSIDTTTNPPVPNRAHTEMS